MNHPIYFSLARWVSGICFLIAVCAVLLGLAVDDDTSAGTVAFGFQTLLASVSIGLLAAIAESLYKDE